MKDKFMDHKVFNSNSIIVFDSTDTSYLEKKLVTDKYTDIVPGKLIKFGDQKLIQLTREMAAKLESVGHNRKERRKWMRDNKIKVL